MLRVESFPHGAGFIISDGLATPIGVTRLIRVRGTLRLARLPAPASTARVAPLPLKGRLHGSRPFTMISSFQLTRTAKLRLALSGGHGVRRRERPQGPTPPQRMGLLFGCPLPPCPPSLRGSTGLCGHPYPGIEAPAGPLTKLCALELLPFTKRLPTETRIATLTGGTLNVTMTPDLLPGYSLVIGYPTGMARFYECTGVVIVADGGRHLGSMIIQRGDTRPTSWLRSRYGLDATVLTASHTNKYILEHAMARGTKCDLLLEIAPAPPNGATLWLRGWTHPK